MDKKSWKLYREDVRLFGENDVSNILDGGKGGRSRNHIQSPPQTILVENIFIRNTMSMDLTPLVINTYE